MCHLTWLVLLVTSTLVLSALGAPQGGDIADGLLRLKQGDNHNNLIRSPAANPGISEFLHEQLSLTNDVHNIHKRQQLPIIPNDYVFRHWARQGDLEKTKYYLNLTDVHVNDQDARNWTALIWASRYGHDDVVEFLLGEGAEVNLRNFNNDTALLWAVGGGHLDIVEMLMLHGADPNIPEVTGLTPVSVAAAMGREAELRMMDKYGFIDLDHQDNNGRTPLNLASMVGHAGMVQLLGYYGNIDIYDLEEMAPTHWSVNLVDTSTLIACLQLCPDLTLVDDRNNTALAIARLVGNTKAEQLIIEHLADPGTGCFLGADEIPIKEFTFFDCKQLQCMCKGWWRHTGVVDNACVKRQVNVLSRQQLEKYEYSNGTMNNYTTSTASPSAAPSSN